MKQKFKVALIGLLTLVSLALILFFAAIGALESHWFQQRLRDRIVSEIEQTTGGHVELGAFYFDWRKLRADLSDLVIKGAEGRYQEPLLRVESVRAGLRLISPFTRNLDIASLAFVRPRVHILVNKDGSTNIPGADARRDLRIETLLDIRVRRLEIRDGLLKTNLSEAPLNLTADHVYTSLNYDRSAQQYRAILATGPLRLTSGTHHLNLEATSTRGRLMRSLFVLEAATFSSHNSQLNVTGTLKDFARPSAYANFTLLTPAPEVARQIGLLEVREGEVSATGSATFSAGKQLTYSGAIGGRNLGYFSKSIDLRQIRLTSGFSGTPTGIEFHDVHANAAGASFSGTARVEEWRKLDLHGDVSGLNVSRTLRPIAGPKVPWSGTLVGPFHFVSNFNGPANPLVNADFRVQPAGGPFPLSGHLSFTLRDSRLQFAESYLASGATQITFSGVPATDLHLSLTSSDLNDLQPALALLPPSLRRLPVSLSSNGMARFDGQILSAASRPQIQGLLSLSHFAYQGREWDSLQSGFSLDSTGISASNLALRSAESSLSARGSLALSNWTYEPANTWRIAGTFQNVAAAPLLRSAGFLTSVTVATASGSFDLNGTALAPSGSADLRVFNINLLSNHLDQALLPLHFSAGKVDVSRGSIQAGLAKADFTASYTHAPNSWHTGEFDFRLSSNKFPLAEISAVHARVPGLDARSEVTLSGAARLTPSGIEPLSLNGTAVLEKVTFDRQVYGDVTFNASTKGPLIALGFSGDLRDTHFAGTAETQLSAGNPTRGEVHVERLNLASVAALTGLPGDTVQGFLRGGVTFEGLLKEPGTMHGKARVDQLEISSGVLLPPESGQKTPAPLLLRNRNAILFDFANGTAQVRRFDIAGASTTLSLKGSVPYLPGRALNVHIDGTVDLRIFRLFDRNVRSSGRSTIAASATGPLSHPNLDGTLQIQDGAFFLNNVSNGLSAVNGIVRFDKDRASITHLTGHTGGGEISMGGSILFGKGPLTYQLEAEANEVRLRPTGNLSVTGTARLRLTGTSQSSVLSGTARISRVVVNPGADLGTLLAVATAPSAAPANEQDFLTGLQLDVHAISDPDLQVSTELSRDLNGSIDLRLRGTPAHPVVLGSIAANQGDINIFGTRYAINRGEVTFINTARIEPVVDFDLQTQVRGIEVNITVAGTPGKLNVNYRSDPPLQPRDIIALLAVGRTPATLSNIPNAQLANDVTALQSGPDTVLGQAVSPASNRLSKLFGVTNIRIDPLAQGYANTAQARLTLEEQVSREITITYVTNLSQTAEQIFRLEWAFSPQYSVVAIRDDNGEFGIDIQYRKRFK